MNPHRDSTNTRLGELLLSRSLLNRSNLAAAVEHGERRHVPLVEAVVSLGFVTESDSYIALANCTGLRLVGPSELTPSNLALRLVPERVARRHVLLPLTEDNRLLTYAISRPFGETCGNQLSTSVSFVTCSCSEPSAFIFQTCIVPVRSELK